MGACASAPDKKRSSSAAAAAGGEKAPNGGAVADGGDILPAGSKNEMFFDSRAWLDSDCDDDFYSVNGEFTPSRGSTPKHPLSLSPAASMRVAVPVSGGGEGGGGGVPELSPTSRKKLSDLLQETLLSERPAVPRPVAEPDAAAAAAPNGDAAAAARSGGRPAKPRSMWRSARSCLMCQVGSFDLAERKVGAAPQCAT